LAPHLLGAPESYGTASKRKMRAIFYQAS
jgi:hypothetical protein